MDNIAHGSCLNGDSVEGTALNYAIETGRLEILNEILDYKPDIHEGDSKDEQ